MADEDLNLEQETESQEEEPKQAPKPVKDETAERYNNVLAALTKEREKSKALEEQYQSTLMPLKQELEQWRENQTRAQQAERDPVDVLTEKVSHLEAERNMMFRAQEETRRHAEERAQFMSQLSGAVSQYRAENPDYDDAYRYVVQRRMQDYGVFGYTPMDAAQMIDAEAHDIGRIAVSRGQNPAEVIMRLARGWGWSPKTSEGESATEGAEEMETRHTPAVSRTLSGKGGRPATGPTSTGLKDIEKMSGEEFDKFWENMKRAGKLG